MSIIYDALKKVEKNTDNGLQVNAEPTSKKLIKPKPVLIYILVVVMGLFAGNMIFGILTKPKVQPTPLSALIPTVTSVNNTPAAIQREEPAPLQEATKLPEPTLVLNGVFFQQDRGYALINNRILTVDDTIQGATVEEINLDKVGLDFEGRKITLINTSR